MNPLTILHVIPLAAWFIAIVELILGMYALVLNAWHTANRHTAALLMTTALASFATGALSNSSTAASASTPAMLLAITTPAITPLALAAALALMRPTWSGSRRRWLWWPIYFLTILPFILTACDVFFHTSLWYTPIQPQTYRGGFVSAEELARGWASTRLGLPVWAGVSGITVALLIYFALSKSRSSFANRKLAWTLAFTHIGVWALQAWVYPRLLPAAANLLTGAILTIAYGYACFTQMLSERRRQRGSLQMRLTALVLTVTIPLMIIVSIFVTTRAGQLLEAYAENNLRTSNRLIAEQVKLWMEAQGRSLQQVVGLADMRSLDIARQQPILEDLAANDPEVMLASTIDLNGVTLARSDGGTPEDYSQEAWFRRARAGVPLTFQAAMNQPEPALIVAAPIRDAQGEVRGVGMLASKLSGLNRLMETNSPGVGGFIWALDDRNQIVAGSGVTLEPGEEVPFTGALSIAAVQQTLQRAQQARVYGEAAPGQIMHTYRDQSGKVWRVVASLLPNNWAVMAQIPESNLLSSARLFQQVAWLATGVAALLLFGLSYLTIRQGIQPIKELTETATNIAAGDLTRVAAVESEDEIGLLARAFNSMTGQLRELISNLERRVEERTREIERKAVQLQVTAEVASQAAAIRDLDELLQHTVKLISTRFNFYHAGIFLIDEAGKFAVLRAASSEGGKRMLKRGHKLEVGKVGIVGHVAAQGKARIALDVGADAVYFNNPDLPQTRSEMALPLIVRERVIGVLDVQSTKASAFNEEDAVTMQTLADQVALAIENTRLLAEMQRAMQELKNLYELQVGQAWQKRLGSQPLVYVYDRLGVKALRAKDEADAHDEGDELSIPVSFRGQTLGKLILRKEAGEPGWTEEDLEIIHSVAAQVGMALENARLLEETQRRAEREKQLAEITARLRASNDAQTILKTAAGELLQALRLKQAQVLLNPPVGEADLDVSGKDAEAAGGNGHSGGE